MELDIDARELRLIQTAVETRIVAIQGDLKRPTLGDTTRELYESLLRDFAVISTKLKIACRDNPLLSGQ